MTVLWDSATLDPHERHDALRETIRERVVRVELDLPRAPDQVQAKVALSDIGNVQLCSVAAMPTRVTRSSKHAHADDVEPALFLTLQVSGTSAMVQHERQAVLHPREFAVYATHTPYTLSFDNGVQNHFFRFRLKDLALPDTVVRDVSARSMGRVGDGIGALTSTYLSSLATSPELRSGVVGDNLASPTIELVRAALLGTFDGSPDARAATAASLAGHVVQYMRAHLDDAALSAATIAAAHDISIRYLYTVLFRAGISLGDWIRTERLARCRADLARSGSRRQTVAAIAARWGFADATHFARVFRAAYGLSPGQWRQLQATTWPDS